MHYFLIMPAENINLIVTSLNCYTYREIFNYLNYEDIFNFVIAFPEVYNRINDILNSAKRTGCTNIYDEVCCKNKNHVILKNEELSMDFIFGVNCTMDQFNFNLLRKFFNLF